MQEYFSVFYILKIDFLRLFVFNFCFNLFNLTLFNFLGFDMLWGSFLQKGAV